MQKALLAALVVCLVAALGAGAAPRRDYAAFARDILPPGNFGGINFNQHSSDQAVLYDALTPRFDQVTARDVTKDFKAEKFYRDVKLCTIGEGTSEIQRLVIARQLLKD